MLSEFSANIYLFKVNNKNTRKRCEICSGSRIKCCSDIFIILEHKITPLSSVSIADFEQVNATWIVLIINTY